MSLVAYGSSDEEDTAEEIVSKFEQVTPNSTENLADVVVKKQRESVKITIPSLKEFEDDENETPKKKPKFQPKPGSGLFSILPPPKNSSSLSKPGFVPYVLSKKEQKPSTTTVTIKTDISSHVSSEPVRQDSDDDITHESAQISVDAAPSSSNVDYFSLDSEPNAAPKRDYDSSNQPNLKTLPVTSNDNILVNTKAYNTHLSSESISIDPTSIHEEIGNDPYSHQELLGDDVFHCHSDYQSENSEEPNPTDALLKDKEFLKLQGRRREFENIDIIDVNAADQLLDRNQWLMKSLTEESTHRPSKKKHNMPTSQQKRKHQITYLAFQAKEREMDLKNQWAMNSRTRRETQAKYGF